MFTLVLGIKVLICSGMFVLFNYSVFLYAFYLFNAVFKCIIVVYLMRIFFVLADMPRSMPSIVYIVFLLEFIRVGFR